MNDIPNPNELFPNEYGTSCFIKNAASTAWMTRIRPSHPERKES